ncbi:dual specificity mitogen-activated kinase kinase 6 [Brachionus plicatilis]|uniref:mitogen-activated protein kinase kinase n=1 Tax=Brachionus plicatilis TaxID=10195 RepID=A0A3M7RH96_BRAPC|nr:dual specificity mitogen-activated kinase kinase 6 [Brachionus plicatilis]
MSKKPRTHKLQMSLPVPQPRRNLDLARECKITINENGEPKEYVVNFNELERGDLLGRGQFGTVTRMFHKPSNMTFAVKMINDDLMEGSDSQNQAMDLKAPLKMGDKCPSLIRFFGAIHAESAFWILTEVMDTSLDRFYSKIFALEMKMTELFLSKVAHAVVAALDYMKQLHMMHRDIKPSNILLNYTGEIKVCDFGISGFTTNSVCKTFKGCQRYMPPEKIDPSLTGEGYSIKADIWSLGISLIEIATGHHPFKDSPGLLGLIKVIVSKDPPKLDETKFSPELCEFANKCLVKMPDNRASCSELLDHEFIKKYLEIPNDLEYIKKVMDEVKKDKVDS